MWLRPRQADRWPGSGPTIPASAGQAEPCGDCNQRPGRWSRPTAMPPSRGPSPRSPGRPLDRCGPAGLGGRPEPRPSAPYRTAAAHLQVPSRFPCSWMNGTQTAPTARIARNMINISNAPRCDGIAIGPAAMTQMRGIGRDDRTSRRDSLRSDPADRPFQSCRVVPGSGSDVPRGATVHHQRIGPLSRRSPDVRAAFTLDCWIPSAGIVETSDGILAPRLQRDRLICCPSELRRQSADRLFHWSAPINPKPRAAMRCAAPGGGQRRAVSD